MTVVTDNSKTIKPQKKGHIVTKEDWIMRIFITLGTL